MNKRVKDTGNRVKFKTGAEKDMASGRGRYDLLPLETLSLIYKQQDNENTANFIQDIYKSMVSTSINEKVKHLTNALVSYIEYILNQNINGVIPDLALIFEKGAEKYSARDWEKGRPMIVYINSTLRHFFQYVNGEEDEDHKTAVIWNILACIDTIRRLPSMAYTLEEITEF